MSLHPRVAQALEEIDASCFSGDQFEGEDDLKELEKYLRRWTRYAEQVRKDLAERGPQVAETAAYRSTEVDE